MTSGAAPALLSVVGELDGDTAPTFLERVQCLADEGTRSVVIDLGGECVDPAGVDAVARRVGSPCPAQGRAALEVPPLEVAHSRGRRRAVKLTQIAV